MHCAWYKKLKKLFTLCGIPCWKKASIAFLSDVTIKRMDNRLLKAVKQIIPKFEPVAFFIILNPSGHQQITIYVHTEFQILMPFRSE
jgi:hypothetical protein